MDIKYISPEVEEFNKNFAQNIVKYYNELLKAELSPRLSLKLARKFQHTVLTFQLTLTILEDISTKPAKEINDNEQDVYEEFVSSLHTRDIESDNDVEGDYYRAWMAELSKSYYSALIKAGAPEEAAMELTVSHLQAVLEVHLVKEARQ